MKMEALGVGGEDQLYFTRTQVKIGYNSLPLLEIHLSSANSYSIYIQYNNTDIEAASKHNALISITHCIIDYFSGTGVAILCFLSLSLTSCSSRRSRRLMRSCLIRISEACTIASGCRQ